VTGYPHNVKLAGFPSLDERDLWICQQWGFGRSAKEIAADLGVTAATVYRVTWTGGPGWKTGAKAELAWKPTWDSPDASWTPDDSGVEYLLSPIPAAYRGRALRALTVIRDQLLH